MSTDNNVRVLIADGDATVRAALFRALLDRGVFCDCVASGGDAISRLGEQRYALVLLDFSLPHAGAAAVVESLRVMPSAERPMVIATAAGADSARDPSSLALLRAGSDTDLVQMILRRPIEVLDVAELVGACLAQVRTT
ncbi:MAG: response regulator [Acidobacteriota bacterium]